MGRPRIRISSEKENESFASVRLHIAHGTKEVMAIMKVSKKELENESNVANVYRPVSTILPVKK